MRDLATIQRRFYELVTSGHGTIDPGLLGASRHLAVYADMYVARLVDVLADDHPKLRHILGDAFDDVMTEYVRARPPTSFTLRDAGVALAGYLATRADLPPWAADLARLERARVEVFDAPDRVPSTRADLVGVPFERFPDVTIALVPASLSVPLGWTVDELWTAIEDGAPIVDPEPCDRRVLLWRRDTRVFHRTLDPDEAKLATSLAIGATIADLAAQLIELAAPEPERRVVELLGRWIDADAVVCS